mgnify:CR=1 FL=1
MDGPAVVLIGGAPGAGKTTLARAVAERLGWLALPGDALVTAMRGVTERATHPALHVAGRGRHVEYFTNGPPEKLVDDAIRLQAEAWPGFERVISFHSRFGPSATVDSWTFTPGNVAGLELDNAVAVWIVIDRAELEKREQPQPGYVDPSPDPERRRSNFLHRSLWCNGYMEREAKLHGMPVLYQDGTHSVSEHVAAVLDTTLKIPNLALATVDSHIKHGRRGDLRCPGHSDGNGSPDRIRKSQAGGDTKDSIDLALSRTHLIYA